VPDAPRYRELDERLATGIRHLLNAAAMSALGIATGVAEVGKALAKLDPVILGGIRHPHRPIAAWVVLAQWDW
jgi:hypothetical protein